MYSVASPLPPSLHLILFELQKWPKSQIKISNKTVFKMKEVWKLLSSPLRAVSDEHEKIQKKTFTKWINYHLETVSVLLPLIAKNFDLQPPTNSFAPK